MISSLPPSSCLYTYFGSFVRPFLPFKKHFCSQWLDIKAMVQRQNDPCPLVFRTPDADRFFPMIRIGLRCCTPACIVTRQRFGAAGGESGSSGMCF